MFYLVDKPIGPSSNQALNHIRRFFATEKAGHSGTLDPLASGLLIVATNGSTKLLSQLETQTKWYQFTFDITKTSESLDLGTPTHSLPADHQIFHYRPTQDNIEEIIKTFIGTINQIPPKYSAISLDGKRAYREVRKGNVVDLPTRKVEVYHIELLDYTFPEVTLLVHISAGGYVRSLARDISRDLGGSGVVTALRRTKIANIPLETSALSYAEGHPGEYIGIKEIWYEVIFPDIQRIDLSDEEMVNISLGHAIPRRSEITSTQIFGYYQNAPIVLLREKWNTFAPTRFKI